MQEKLYSRPAEKPEKVIACGWRKNGPLRPTAPSDGKKGEKQMQLLNTGLGVALSNLTAFQLLIAGGLLLGVAALLLALGRERRVSVKPSAVTEELAVHMGRIANALENLADPLRDRSHFTDLRERGGPQKPTEDAHHVSYSIFGR
jgi:hypothetical protein